MATAQRLRTYLTRDEVTQLLRVVKKTRHGARNHAMILLAYRHGLRASELVGLQWSDVELERGDHLLSAREGIALDGSSVEAR